MNAPRLALALALAAFACAPTQPACSPEARDAIKAIYADAAGRVIDSGACDKYERVENCPAYRIVEANFVATLAACK